jgi:hypothetical protein
MVYTFMSSEPGVQSLVLSTLCMFFGFWHLSMTPLRNLQSQTLQTVLLFCLAGLALSELPFTIQLEKGTASVPGSTRASFASDALSRRMQIALGVVVPALAGLWAFTWEMTAKRVGGVWAYLARRVRQWPQLWPMRQ